MKKLKDKYIFEIEYGSDWQKECGEKMILATFQAIKMFRESRHKKNKVYFAKI